MVHGRGLFDAGNKIRNYVQTRNDAQLAGHLIRLADDNPREVLKICVGNFIYGNHDFLYSDTYTEMLYRRHSRYLAEKKKNLTDELDFLSTRLYNVSIGEYLKNQIIDDVLSMRLSVESCSFIHQVFPSFEPNRGVLSEGLVTRIQRSSALLPINDELTRIVLQYGDNLELTK